MAKSRLLLALYVVALILLWWHAAGIGMDNRGFVVAGYALTWGILLGYAHRLGRRGTVGARALGAMDQTTDGT